MTNLLQPPSQTCTSDTAVPDIITISRIVVAAGLLFAAPFSVVWYLLYAWCGISDVLDGFCARKLDTYSPRGARLDSAADCVFVAAVAVGCIPVLAWEPWMVVWIAAIALVRIATLVICHKRFGCISFLHTWANKATGIALFSLFALLPALGLPLVAVLSCTAATFSSVEELLLMARMPTLDLDRKGFWTH